MVKKEFTLLSFALFLIFNTFISLAQGMNQASPLSIETNQNENIFSIEFNEPIQLIQNFSDSLSFTMFKDQRVLQNYDYELNQEEDIISPISGNPGNWVYIIGGNIKGDYYVSPYGNDSSNGSFESPWRTLSFAVQQIQPGDTLVVLPGSGRTRPIIAGGNNLRAAFDLSGKNYIWIENLEITHNDNLSGDGKFFRDGIVISGNKSTNIVLKNLYIHHIDEFGLNFQDIDSLKLLDSRIEYCGFGALGGPAGESGGWRFIEIKGCNLSYSGHYYQGGDGSNSPYDRPDGFGIEASEGPIEISNTIASHNYGDGLDSKAKRTYIHECIVANNSCDGVKLWGDSSSVVNTLIYGRGDGNATTTPWSPLVISTENHNSYFEIINCTIDDTVGENYIMHVQYDSPTIPVYVRIVNSIFCSRGNNAPTIWLGDSVNYNITYNLFYSPNDDRLLIKGNTTYTSLEIEQIGPGNKYGNPLFYSVGWGFEGNYHLKPNSPGIDSGDPLSAPTNDLEGNLRPQGNGVDIGCYENLTGTKTEDGFNVIPANLELFQNYPNPFNSKTKIKFKVPNSSYLTLKVFDLLGNEIKTLIDEFKKPGIYEIEFDASGLTSGVYFYQLKAGKFIKTRKMILVK